MDNTGQISFEYLMIFAVSLIMLIVFTMPLAQTAIENTLDVSGSLDVKNNLEKITSVIKEVYSQGQGAKQELNVETSRNINIDVGKSVICCNLKLKDGSNKFIKQSYNSKLKQTHISLKKGVTTLVVEWPSNSENMLIYEK